MDKVRVLTRGRRLVGAVALGGLAFSFLPGAAKAAPPDPPAPASTAAFRANIPNSYNPFSDDNGDTFENEIECVSSLGIALGGPGGRPASQFLPGGTVARDQMASFIARQIDAANRLDAAGAPDLQDLPAYNGTNRFSADTPNNNAHVANINRLAQAGVVNGTSSTQFAPSATVTRAQVASFINRAQAFLLGQNPANAGASTGFVAPGGANYFTDDAPPHEANINGIASVGIYVGDGVDTASPTNGLPRNQMSALLCRQLAVNNSQGRIGIAPVPAGTSNQVFTVTGATASQQAQGSTRAACSVAVPNGTVVDLQLFPTANISNASGTNVTFEDANGNNQADPGTTTATMTTTTGAAVTGSRIDDITSPGTISFTITAPATPSAPIDVTAVVFRDNTADNDALDLTAGSAPRRTPTEQFGIGCRTVFVPAEASGGAFGGGNSANPPTAAVTYVDKTEDFLTINTPVGLLEYDSNDVYLLNGVPTTFTTWEAALSTGDAIGGTYAPEAGATSTFNLQDVLPAAPTITDGGSSGTTARIDVTGPSSNAGVDVYRLQRCTGDAAACGGATASFTQVAEVPATGQFPQELTDTSLSAGTTYTYRVVAVDDGDTSANSNTVSYAATAPAGDTTGPVAQDVELAQGAGNASSLDSGDSIVICFNEELQAPATGGQASSITVSDADGTVAVLTNGGNATFNRNPIPDPRVSTGAAGVTSCPANQGLTVTVTGAITPTTTGTNPTVAVNATGPTISDAAFIVDTSGNPFRTTGSPDLLANVEAGPEPD